MFNTYINISFHSQFFIPSKFPFPQRKLSHFNFRKFFKNAKKYNYRYLVPVLVNYACSSAFHNVSYAHLNSLFYHHCLFIIFAHKPEPHSVAHAGPVLTVSGMLASSSGQSRLSSNGRHAPPLHASVSFHYG